MKTILFIITFALLTASGDSVLRKYFNGSKVVTQLKLNKKLKEISGLAWYDGKLFCHDDERGIVYILSEFSGEIIKQYKLKGIPKKDFEGIAVVGDYIYLVTSCGKIYEFHYTKKRKSYKYKTYKTGIKCSYDIEGLCYNKNMNSLVLVAKDDPKKKYRRKLFVFSLDDYSINKNAGLNLDLRLLNEEYGIADFYPSGIEIHPVSGNYVVLSARTKQIMELSPSGRVLSIFKINKKFHNQPEGITFTYDNTMIISDEAQGKKPRITLYDYQNN